MNNIKEYITEKLKINKDINIYNYYPKDKDELILRIDCEVSNEKQYKFLMKTLNDIVSNSDEFDILLFNDVRYADGSKGNIVDKYKCVVADGEILTVNRQETTNICFPFKIKAKIEELYERNC